MLPFFSTEIRTRRPSCGDEAIARDGEYRVKELVVDDLIDVSSVVAREGIRKDDRSATGDPKTVRLDRRSLKSNRTKMGANDNFVERHSAPRCWRVNGQHLAHAPAQLLSTLRIASFAGHAIRIERDVCSR
jgi:hypothetical protein